MTDLAPQTSDERASAIVDAFNGDPVGFATSAGTVVINDVQIGEAANVIIVKAQYSEEEIIIINPPCYLPAVDGDVDVNGVMFKYDPLAALAEVIGMHVGGS